MDNEKALNVEQSENSAEQEAPNAVLSPVSDVNCFEDVYEDTLYFVDGMVEQYDFYPEIIGALANGTAKLELKKRYMLKAIDEEWISKIEDCIPALDEVIRTPSRFIEETEKVLPIELSRNISSRSIKHLSQHTDYISKVEGDTITPSKILNVFRDETNKTYENKFVNTLINRLFWFVEHRYETALKEGKDEKNTSLDYSQSFTHGELQGKIHFRMEISEEPKTGEELKNYTYTTDLWQRVIHLHHVCRAYINSSFVKSMENQFVRPPIIRTNAILKNKNLRQCLELWEFIESYENIGYNMLVQENLETLDARYIKEIYSISALQYLIFRYNIKNEFDSDKTLASAATPALLTPEIRDELGELDASEFHKAYSRSMRRSADARSIESRKNHRERAILRAVDVALISDSLIKKLDLSPKFPKRRLKPVWVKKLENTAEQVQVTAKKIGADIQKTTVKAATATANGVKVAANGVKVAANSVKAAADGVIVATGGVVKKGWDASVQRLDDYCRENPEKMEKIADTAAEIALNAAYIGAVVMLKEKERNK